MRFALPPGVPLPSPSTRLGQPFALHSHCPRYLLAYRLYGFVGRVDASSHAKLERLLDALVLVSVREAAARGDMFERELSSSLYEQAAV